MIFLKVDYFKVILPTKRLRSERALLTVGREILLRLDKPKTVSRLWSEIDFSQREYNPLDPLKFDWFVLALDFLYSINAIILSDGLLTRHSERDDL